MRHYHTAQSQKMLHVFNYEKKKLEILYCLGNGENRRWIDCAFVLVELCIVFVFALIGFCLYKTQMNVSE